jgi:hypothetical protein
MCVCVYVCMCGKILSIIVIHVTCFTTYLKARQAAASRQHSGRARSREQVCADHTATVGVCPT